MTLTFELIARYPSEFEQLCGVSLSQFQEIVEKIRPQWKPLYKSYSQRDYRINSIEDNVMITLIRHHCAITFSFLSGLLPPGISDECIQGRVKRLEKIFPPNLKINKDPAMKAEAVTKLLENIAGAGCPKTHRWALILGYARI